VNTTSNVRTVATLVSVALSGGAAVAQETISVFRPEVTLSLTCDGDMSTREHVLQRFLRAHGFDVLDLSRSNDNSGRTFPQNAAVLGIDAQRRIVELDSHDAPETASFSLSLVAPPAGTRGTERLRDELEHFGRKNLQCTVESVHYRHNSPSEADAYEQWARRVGSAIREASRMPRTLFSPVSRCTLTSIAR
jgi:hypothetical protein